MCVICHAAVSFAIATAGVAGPVAQAPASPPSSLPACTEQELFCPATANNDLARLLGDYPEPSVAAPNLMFATPDFAVHRPFTQTVKYQVAVLGAVGVDLAAFKQQVKETLQDDRGWSRLGVRFEYADTGGAFTLVLAEAAQVPNYGSPCDTVWNCQVGGYVIANNDRWMHATDPWNAAGGTIRDYRHMTINHELGHWLGHGHTGCAANGQAAPVMQQQSMDLQGCKFNPWPLDSELKSTRFGI